MKKINIDDGIFRYHTFRATPNIACFSKDYIQVNQFQITIDDLYVDSTGFGLQIREMEGADVCGFQLKKLNAKLSYSDSGLHGSDIQIETPQSFLALNNLDLSTKPDQEQTFLDRLSIRTTIANESYLSEKDLAYFIPNISGSSVIEIDGKVSMNQGRLSCEDVDIVNGEFFQLQGELDIGNLQDIRNSEFTFNLDSLIYYPLYHKNSLLNLLIDPDTLKLPFNWEEIDPIHFRGTFEGSLNSIVTKGSIKSKAFEFSGNLISGISDSLPIRLLSGNLTGAIYNFDSLFDSRTGLRNIEFSSGFGGTAVSLTEYSILLNLNLRQLNWREYNYENIYVQGNAINQTFDGVLIVEDENVDVELEAMVDFSGSIPSFNFGLDLREAHLNAINVSSLDSLEVLDLHLRGNFSGMDLDDLEGNIWLTNSYYQNSRGKLPFEQIDLSIGPELGQRKISLVSDYIDARLLGEIHLNELLNQMELVVRQYLPVRLETSGFNGEHVNDFTFNLQLKNPRPLTEILTPKVIFKDNTQLSGFFKEGGRQWEIEGTSPQYVVSGRQFTNLVFRASSYQDTLLFNCSLGKLQLDAETEFDKISASFQMVPDNMEADIAWQNQDTIISKGRFQPSIRFEPGLSVFPRTIINMAQSELIYKDTIWQINPARYVLDHQYFRIDSLIMQHNNETLLVDGIISDLPHDTLYVGFNELNLRHLSAIKENRKFNLAGIVDGEAKLFNLHEKGLFLANLNINDFTINGELLGLTHLNSQRKSGSDEVFMEVVTQRGDISTINMSGTFNPVTDKVDFIIDLEKLRMNVFNALLDPVLRDIRGIASGEIIVNGYRSDPKFYGEIMMQKAGLNVEYLKTRYTFTHPLIVTPEGFLIEGLIARDRFGNEAIVNGGVYHDRFKNITLDLNLEVKDFLCLETTEAKGERYWGTAFATGLATLKGPVKQIKIDISAETKAGTNFSVPVSRRGSVREINFITYVKKDSLDIDPDLFNYNYEEKDPGYDVDLSGIELQIDLNVTPEAQVQIIINSITGDVIRARGRGNLILDVNKRAALSINGSYIISEGDYLLTMQNMPIKRFDIQPGGSVNMNGDIKNANLDIVAVYKTKAALYDLVLDESDQDLKQRIPVECHLLKSGLLEAPGLEFEIVLPPNSDDVARSQLSNLTEEELNKQILTLLILNRFSPLPGLSSSTPRSYESAGISTTTEVLSNQLNYLLSQISNDLDIGFNYRPGDELTSDEVEVALSTQLLDDRMTINVNGNVDVRQVETNDNANQLVGDVEIEYKIVPSGKLRVKAFTRANDRLLYEYSDYTQGFGIFFREEFDRFPDLLRKYWNSVFKKDTTGQIY